MTTFDEKIISLGILLDPDFFTGDAAWEPRNPADDAPNQLVFGWAQHWLPVLEPGTSSDFGYSCTQRLKALSESSEEARSSGLIVAVSSWPEGYLVFGAYRSLLSVLTGALNSEYPQTTPADYCTSVYVDPDDPDGLSYLNETPSPQNIKEVCRELERLESFAPNLDRARAWALFVGASSAAWETWWSESALAEWQQLRKLEPPQESSDWDPYWDPFLERRELDDDELDDFNKPISDDYEPQSIVEESKELKEVYNAFQSSVRIGKPEEVQLEAGTYRTEWQPGGTWIIRVGDRLYRQEAVDSSHGDMEPGDLFIWVTQTGEREIDLGYIHEGYVFVRKKNCGS